MWTVVVENYVQYEDSIHRMQHHLQGRQIPYQHGQILESER